MVVDMVPFMGAFFGPAGATAESMKPAATAMRDRMATTADGPRRQLTEATIATMVRTESLRADPVAHAMASDPKIAARGMYDLITTDLRPELARIKVPTTVLYVRAPTAPISDEQMDAVYQASFAAVPGATLKRISDSYHFIMFDQPERFAAEVKGFLGDR
jgi:pimeloyl-ACP methyl ester carboxylesterase